MSGESRQEGSSSMVQHGVQRGARQGARQGALRGAVIGYGFISSSGHVPSYLKRARERGDVEIVAVADPCSAREALAREAIPGARTYSDYRDLLKTERKLDFVDICAPPYAHGEIARAALESGLHVLCEKPLTTSADEAEDLIGRASRLGLVLFPCHNYKHAPVVTRVREIIQSGRIGKVRSMTLSTFRNTHAKGVPEWRKDWRRERRYSGGGIAMDHGSHAFYLMFDWMQSYPVSISAKMSSSVSDTEDYFSATLTFPNGLAQAVLTWTAGVRKVIYTVQGENGAITVDDDKLELALMSLSDGPDVGHGAVKWSFEREAIRSNWMDPSHVGWFDSLFESFLKAIQEGDWAGKEALEAFRSIQIIEAAYQSASKGSQEVRLD